VIHNGKIPSVDESMNYGQAVFDVIVPILAILKSKDPEFVHEIVEWHVIRMGEKIKEDPTISFMTTPTTISINRAASEPNPSFTDGLSRLKERRVRIGW
jgi:hypothetical protein